jgi:5-methyltetrahydropteroyltriglutamate--homocysteine methyltransferase
MSVDAVRFLKQHTSKPVKANVVGPLTAAFYLKDEFYHDDHVAALALAAALNQELRAIEAEGVDLLQVDEPVLHYNISRARRYGREVINRTVEGLRTPVVVHVCYGYAALIEKHGINPEYADVLDIMAGCDIWGMSLEYEEPGHQADLLRHCGDKHVVLGLLNMGTHAVETPEQIANRIREALEFVPAERLHLAPDCGMWHLPREVAFAKLCSLTLGADIVRRELGLNGA